MRGVFVNSQWPRRGLCRGCVQWAATNKAHMRAGCAYSTLKSMKKQENAMECNPHSLQEALLHLDERGNDPPFQTFVSLLRFCTSSRALSHGKALHNHIRRRGLDSSPVLGGLLVQMYGDCGALQEACHAFANIHPRSVFAWNVMIRAHAMNGQGLHALYFLQHMHHEGITPGKITFISILSICSHEGALCEGRKIHVIIIDGPFMGCVMVRNGLVNMYGKCGCLEEAQREFDMMAERNVISWTAMIAACAQNGVGKYTLQLFQQMQQEGALPDNIAFISMLDACAGELALVEGKQTHARIASCGVESDVVLGTALINLYNKCGCLKYADEVFNGMPQRNLVAWTAIIETHACHGQGKEALQLFNQMQLEGIIPNKFTIVSVLDAIGSEGALSKGKQVHAMIVGSQFDSDALVDTAIVNMYGKCHSLEDAQDAFYKLSNRDVVMWTALIAVYVQNRQGAEGLQLFSGMLQEGVMPNKVTFISALDACASKGALFDGKWIHAQALETKFESNIFVGNALVDMYGKCGSLQNARRMFDRMSERDMVTWNTMVATYAHHGHGKTALHLFHQMQQEGVPIDQVSFLTIISACSHAGLVDEGLQCFASMYQKHGIAPVVRHYNSLIDLLGRAGRLDEAENLTSNMHPQPNLVSLITLLGAYRHPADAGQGEHAAKPAVSLDLESCVADLMLSKILCCKQL